ncbi:MULTISPECIES: hypothetical protein [unclassified Novosphingobium]|uniref:hypothetical protein n=1 Tax=unclassified Novosphingobium TaxID=2644732 RepID=UPI00146E97C7|nr:MULTISPECIES: hypothetical protein [unclassified Novosphingobium]NMN05597.1 hypothetical protein [Novosphingobium sp. SG919]NMN88044.1 hypothetical protein [Novosphingobium sp. SG916]
MSAPHAQRGPVSPDTAPATSARHAAIVASLARPQDVRALSLTALHVVMAMRLSAMFERVGRDPVPDLAQRYRSVEAAAAVHALVRRVIRTWPERFLVNRPCQLVMTPDEATLAAMTRHALAGDSDGFAELLRGFVRADRLDGLYHATQHAAALLSGRSV